MATSACPSRRATVAQDLIRVFPATLELASLSMLLSALLGITLAVLSTRYPDGWLDALVRVLSLIGNSCRFLARLLALFLFYAQLQWAGGPGRLDDAYEYTISMPTACARGCLPAAFPAHLPAPSATWSCRYCCSAIRVGNVTRLLRAALLGESRKEYTLLPAPRRQPNAGALESHGANTAACSSRCWRSAIRTCSRVPYWLKPCSPGRYRALPHYRTVCR